ncbi:MAG: hypothetical protein GY820_10890 [Gammaproteobacteria bacterium]|nr:hypothetical protein [Gammaproteobacteria bacterium]
MVSRFFKKEKPRVYLSSLAVVPRVGFKTIDEWGFNGRENFDGALRQELTEIFDLPHVSTIADPRKTDLALDVVIPRYQGGANGDFNFGEIGLPIFWRPKVEVRSRVFEIQSNKTLHVFSVVQKMRWLDYFSRTISLRRIFSFQPLFTIEDIEYLTLLACGNLLNRMRAKI